MKQTKVQIQRKEAAIAKKLNVWNFIAIVSDKIKHVSVVVV